jgi:hypothetical protein
VWVHSPRCPAFTQISVFCSFTKAERFSSSTCTIPQGYQQALTILFLTFTYLYFLSPQTAHMHLLQHWSSGRLLGTDIYGCHFRPIHSWACSYTSVIQF